MTAEPNGQRPGVSGSMSKELSTTGPKIIGVQLGMDLDKAVEIFSSELKGIKFAKASSQFGNCAKSLEGKFPHDRPKSESEAMGLFLGALMGGNKGMSVKLGANEKNELIHVEIGGGIVNELFETEDMSDERFIQIFIDSYQIPQMEQSLEKVSDIYGDGFEGVQTMWTHESDSGFVLKIYGSSSSDNTLFDTAKSNRTIEIYKIKSASEAKSRFR